VPLLRFGEKKMTENSDTGCIDGKRLRVLLVAVGTAAVLLTAATGTAAAQSAPDCSTVTYNGDGSTANPFEVSNVDQLQCMNESHADVISRGQALGENYRLVSDIDASDTAFWNNGDGFAPIGDGEDSFFGTFDGNGHEITGLSINRRSENDVGLFRVVGTTGRVTDVSLRNVDVTGDFVVGGLVGFNDDGTVTNTSASGNVNGGGVIVGGLVADNDGTVSESSASGNVSGDVAVGGFVGVNDGTVTESSASGNAEGDGGGEVGGLVGKNNGIVRNSSATGNATGNEDIGGLVGFNSQGIVRGSSASGNVSGEDLAGGLVGENNGTVRGSSASGDVTVAPIGSGAAVGALIGGGLVGTNKDLVRDSSASGDVTGTGGEVGGLVGFNDDGTVTNTSASGNVNGGGDIVGGLVADNDGTVSESSASGNVSGDVAVGGFVGENFKSTISESSAFGNATGNESVGGFVGLNLGTVENSYARGTADGFENVGGLVGKNGVTIGRVDNAGTVRKSYATGAVIDPLFVPDPVPDPSPGPILSQDSSTRGGLIGNNTVGTVTDSYWDVNTSGLSFSEGGTGLTTEEMTGSAATNNMQGFDFTNTWKTVSGDYPILAFQSTDDGDDGGFSLDDYRNQNGVVDTAGLQQAINDFIQNRISTGDLQAVINAFVSGQ